MVVGLCVERSLEMLVGLLGILKAGGAYLPSTLATIKWMKEEGAAPAWLT